MILRRLVLAILLATGTSLTTTVAAEPPLRVVASFSILADIARNVGGDRVVVTSIVGPDADAHVYDPRPSDVAALAGADVVLTNGLGFEGWMDRLVDSSGFRGRWIVASAGIEALPADGRADPHAWQDPRNVVRYVDRISAAFAASRPADAASFAANAARYRRDVLALDARIQQAVDALPPGRRRFVTSHDAFGYFARRYGFTILAPQGWSTDDEPSARDVAALIRQLKTGGVRAVFIENMTDPRLIERIAAEGGATVGGRLYSDALARPGQPAGTYLGMMQHNLATLLAALGGP
ncbi:MAG: zinc ABC transporter substrate-binding protein [Steroidobacteraceae bacterium]|jgi:zinc/manganese transport system substrate-binding protein|nr:zinc ABC transporter substrate-binding protein [Steroidobacteraceae bacterium]